ncbi:Kae1-associated kinase Bud32 [Candidatus Pacearchaeota archaeon CG_4_9_14_0_2_um_filter_39_13]|nr:Kae1-associated serine/threonine protein kinase [Candidatus Pacearchaeota archaeon]OIO42659.1 MAG: Kae1-associated kinase Bud32 [Candidatus Pacearchaeota archaeon CG1_02_39_14]PJC44576.1 MAG: Kae1-associated kinase Bud32 [Candidatus Pacearchaeota archaeon CG_4_9_14_0_2_um_filter_39_13]
MKIIAKGAEAVIEKSEKKVVKTRIVKGYRHPILDEKLRKLRTRSEAKILEKASQIIPVPKIISADEKTKIIELEFVAGKKLSDNLEKLDYSKLCRQIGSSLAKLHDAGLIHGDLTTSNLIYKEENKTQQNEQRLISKIGKVYFIDFGLGFHSNKIEDKAVDLHLIKKALEARHSKIHEKAFRSVLEGYKSAKDYKKIIKQLEKVEARGRYKKGS